MSPNWVAHDHIQDPMEELKRAQVWSSGQGNPRPNCAKIVPHRMPRRIN